MVIYFVTTTCFATIITVNSTTTPKFCRIPPHRPHTHLPRADCRFARQNDRLASAFLESNDAYCSHSASVEADNTGWGDEGRLGHRGAVQRGERREPDLRGSWWQAAPEADVVSRQYRDRRVLSVRYPGRVNG